MQQQLQGEGTNDTVVRVVASPYPYLPEGYWYKGGAPRELLRRLIHPLSPKLEVRDFDLFRTVDVPDEHDHALALKYLVDDYEFGRGVEVVEDLPTYFQTRDLTVNEVALHNDKLRYSYTAEEDLESLCLKPTEFVCNAKGEPLSQTFCKAVRFVAEGEQVGVQWELTFLTLPTTVRLFDAALNLDRSLLSGVKAGEAFIACLQEHGFFTAAPSGTEGIVWFVKKANEELPMKAKIFRNLPMDILRSII